jgi:transglutaminase-like putative cysteine protease
VSSKTVSENLTSLGFVSFPQDYPEDVKTFLEPGEKIPSKNQTIQALATNLNQTQNNMTQTVKNILDFVNRQGYDREKTRLLLSGNLNTTDMLDVFKDALKVHDTNSSICLERSWYAAAILRAAGVPTRTVTDVRLKTWIQVWLPNIGWVDAETLCVEPALHVVTLPKSVSTHVPWMIENSSDAAFPFTWLPKVPLRVANLTFAQVELFDVSQYSTVLSKPVDAELFKTDPTKFRFPIAVKSEVTYAAVTEEGSNLVFSLFKGKENASEVLALGEYNSIALGDTAVSFEPNLQEDFLVLQDFAVQDVWMFDYRILVPIVGVPVVLLVIWLYTRRRRHGS